LDKIPQLQKAEEMIGVPKLYLTGGATAFLLLFLFFGIGAGFLCNVVGFIYPAYQSFKAIESKEKKDDTQWLVYWVVYSCFTIVETFVDFILFWIPMYYAFKAAFLIYCYLPSTQGASFIYDNFLKDFLKKHEEKIDATIDKAGASTAKMMNDGKNLATEVIKEGVKKMN